MLVTQLELVTDNCTAVYKRDFCQQTLWTYVQMFTEGLYILTLWTNVQMFTKGFSIPRHYGLMYGCLQKGFPFTVTVDLGTDVYRRAFHSQTLWTNVKMFTKGPSIHSHHRLLFLKKIISSRQFTVMYCR
jgi:hypothetical protein